MRESEGMRFCGFEVQKRKGGGFWIEPIGYLSDLLKKRGIVGKEKYPCPQIQEGPDETEVELKHIREAQAIVGEVMWLSGRSRPGSYTEGQSMHAKSEITFSDISMLPRKPSWTM